MERARTGAGAVRTYDSEAQSDMDKQEPYKENTKPLVPSWPSRSHPTEARKRFEHPQPEQLLKAHQNPAMQVE